MTFTEYMTASLSEAGLSDDQVTAAITKMANNEKLGSKLNALVKTATEDYQAQVGRVRAYQEWYPKAEGEYNRMQAEYLRAVQELEALRNGNQQQPPAFDPSLYVTRQDIQAMEVDRGRRYAGVIKDTAEIVAEHVARFREKPDLNKIDEIATQQNLPLRVAYEKYIEPRVKEEEKAARANWEKQKAEEIERDVRSRLKVPVDPQPAEQSPLFRKPDDKPPADLDTELLNTWRSVPAKA
jgi:hypothetical protein